MAYYISYIVLYGRNSRHSSIALTETDNNLLGSPRLICRVGMGSAGQVLLESSKSSNGIFRHKTYPISRSELIKVLSRINHDRANDKQDDHYYSDIVAAADDKKEFVYYKDQGEFIKSKPGGPPFSLFNRGEGFNCKGYVLSVLAEVLVDESLHNPCFPHPSFSGSLHPLSLRFGAVSKKEEWGSSSLPMIIQARTNYSSFAPEELDALNKARNAHNIRVVASPSYSRRRVSTIAGTSIAVGILCIFISAMPLGIFLLAAIAGGLIGAKIGHWAASKNMTLNTPHSIFQNRQSILVDQHREDKRSAHQVPRNN